MKLDRSFDAAEIAWLLERRRAGGNFQRGACFVDGHLVLRNHAFRIIECQVGLGRGGGGGGGDAIWLSVVPA